MTFVPGDTIAASRVTSQLLNLMHTVALYQAIRAEPEGGVDDGLEAAGDLAAVARRDTLDARDPLPPAVVEKLTGPRKGDSGTSWRCSSSRNHRVPLAAGREITAGEELAGAPVALVNESFVRLHWPDRPAVGQTIELLGARPVTVRLVAPAAALAVTERTYGRDDGCSLRSSRSRPSRAGSGR